MCLWWTRLPLDVFEVTVALIYLVKWNCVVFCARHFECYIDFSTWGIFYCWPLCEFVFGEHHSC